MRKILLKTILIFVTMPMLISAQPLNFGNTYTISSGADGYGRPRVALTNNQPIVIGEKIVLPKQYVPQNGMAQDLVTLIT